MRTLSIELSEDEFHAATRCVGHVAGMESTLEGFWQKRIKTWVRDVSAAYPEPFPAPQLDESLGNVVPGPWKKGRVNA